MESPIYLGTEKPRKLLLKFAVPCIFSLIISCLYNIVDQIFVGNGVGYLGNAATGVIFPVTVIGWGISLFFGDGAAAALSVSLGKNETEHIHRSVGNSILCSFLGGAALILISYIWGDGLLRLIGATDANLALAHDYGFIIYTMIPLALAQNTMASIIRADGSPKYAMGAMLAGAVLNIIGDPVAIFALDMGIKGAAYATILGQFVSFCICAAYLTRSRSFRLSLSSFWLDWRLLKQVMALGASSFLTQLSIVIVTIVNNILLVKYGALSPYGPDIPLGAFVVILKLFQIVLNVAIGIAAGAQPIVGYNYGAKKFGGAGTAGVDDQMDGDRLSDLYFLVRGIPADLYPDVRRGRGALYAVCGTVPAGLSVPHSLYLRSESLCDFSAIHRPRQSRRAFVYPARCAADRIFYRSPYGLGCNRYFLGRTHCRCFGYCSDGSRNAPPVESAKGRGCPAWSGAAYPAKLPPRRDRHHCP